MLVIRVGEINEVVSFFTYGKYRQPADGKYVLIFIPRLFQSFEPSRAPKTGLRNPRVVKEICYKISVQMRLLVQVIGRFKKLGFPLKKKKQ